MISESHTQHSLLLNLFPGAGRSWPGRTTSPTGAKPAGLVWGGEAALPSSSLVGCFLGTLPPQGGGDQRPGTWGSPGPVLQGEGVGLEGHRWLCHLLLPSPLSL